MDIYYILILIFIILFLFIYSYFKLKHPFWSKQPMYHIYNLKLLFQKNTIISNELPELNKFVNTFNIKTLTNRECDKKTELNLVEFIKDNYNNTNTTNYKFIPDYDFIFSYFNYSNKNCYYSIYFKENIEYDASNNVFDNKDIIMGSLLSRPLNINLNNSAFLIYYTEYMCVDKFQRKKNIACELIQTHYYDIKNKHNLENTIGLFKCENTPITTINPIIKTTHYIFNVFDWKRPIFNSLYSYLRINKQNFHLIADILQTNDFKLNIIPDYSTLFSLIESNNYAIYSFYYEKEICGIYFFRKTLCYIDEDDIMYECISSINLNNDCFVKGFHICMFDLCKIEKFKYLNIENIANNNVLINEVIKVHKPINNYNSYYYFYNYICDTIDSNDALLLT